MSEPLDYLRRLLVEVFSQTFRFSREQGFPLLVSVVALVLQVVYRTSMSTDFRGNVLAIIWSFAFAIGVYFFTQLVRAPFTLDLRRRGEIAARDEAIRRLALEPVEVEIQMMYASNPLPNRAHVTVRLDFRIRTGADAVTVHQWAIRSPTFPSLVGTIESVHSLVSGQPSVQRSIRIAEHDVAEINLTCSFYGKPKEEMFESNAVWQLQFEDANHSSYMTNIGGDCWRL